MTVTDYRFSFERIPLAKPFRFKGAAFTEKWVTATSLCDENGCWETGIGGLAVLWSDPGVFAAHSETGGNIVMAAVAERAAALSRGRSFGRPEDLTLPIADELADYAAAVAGTASVRRTFVLNALVSFDCALWKLRARRENTEDMRGFLREGTGAAFASEQHRIARIPLVSYGTAGDEVARLADRGYFFFKIKIGHPGSPEEMLRKDLDRLSELHRLLGSRETPHTDSGNILYYLDANGRYESRDLALRLLEGIDAGGMLDRVAVLEEPFPESAGIDVSGFPVPVAADESVHDVSEVAVRAQAGYRALAVKPAGKTPSVSKAAAAEAVRNGMFCFVADSACIPLLVEWNKVFAACLPPFPSVRMGILESNGPEHYRNWGELLSDHPLPDAPWVQPEGGVFETDERFFRVSGGVFRPYPRYERMTGP